MTDGVDDSTGSRRVSDTVFLSVVGVTSVLVIAVGIYVLGPAASTGTRATPPVSAPVTSRAQVPSSPAAQHSGPTAAGAAAVVEKGFRLALAGKFGASCALESPAYLKFDAEHYPLGSCEAESRAGAKILASHGLSMQLIRTEVLSSTRGAATVLVESTVGTRVITEHVYLRYHGGRRWMTGADDSGGDLGF